MFFRGIVVVSSRQWVQNRDRSFLKGLKREGRNCKHFLFSIYYSRLCPSTERISPSPDSSVFLYPLLSLSILLPVAQQCHISNNILVFHLPFSVLGCVFSSHNGDIKALKQQKTWSILTENASSIPTPTWLNKYGAATVWLQPTVFPLFLAWSWALRFDVAYMFPTRNPTIDERFYKYCSDETDSFGFVGFINSHAAWWRLFVIPFMMVSCLGVCSILQ